MVIIDFIRLPMAVALGLVLFCEAIQVPVLIGGTIILVSLAFLFRSEGRR